MSFDQNTLEQLKQKLEGAKKRLQNDLERFAKPVDSKSGEYETRFENIGTDMDDSATEVEQYVDALGVENTLEQQLQDVNTALDKIEKGTFGKCEVCGEDIAIERLRVYPSAKVCMKHA